MDASVVEGGETERSSSLYANDGEDLSATAFRQSEKRYKLYRQDRRAARRSPLPETDFTDVVDFHCVDANTAANRSRIHAVSGVGDGGMRCFTFSAVPGLLVFPGALSRAEECALCRDAILSFADARLHPNHLSTHARAPRETTRFEPPMRWATLGFSYQWTSKSYARDAYSPFPAQLRERVAALARQVGHVRQDAFRGDAAAAFEAQTAIVNFFPVGAAMMAHQDVSEEVLEQPLLSVSLGCSCVFLMGSDSRNDAPHAFWLRSGDVAVFSGPARTAFHAIPRIMDDCPPHLWEVNSEGMEEEEIYWRKHMQHMRININVRQVYEDTCDFLYE